VYGVPKSAVTADPNSTASGDAYPNMGDYPGNEDQVENWSGETSASEQHLADGTVADVVSKADAGAQSVPKDKSAEGGA